MSQIDNIDGMDWGDAQYIGGGVYIRDSTETRGVPSVALRTDRTVEVGQPGERVVQHSVIVLEQDVFAGLVKCGNEILTESREGIMDNAIQTAREFGAPARISSPKNKKGRS